MGIFVVIEGPDGAGKTTFVELLTMYLRNDKKSFKSYIDPGGTDLGDKIRTIVKSDTCKDVSKYTQALLFAASRSVLSDHIKKEVELSDVVICDRWLLSSLCYQSVKGDELCGIAGIKRLNSGVILPDVQFILCVPPKEAIRRKRGRSDDHFESALIDRKKEIYRLYLNRELDELTAKKTIRLNCFADYESIGKFMRREIYFQLELKRINKEYSDDIRGFGDRIEAKPDFPELDEDYKIIQ